LYRKTGIPPPITALVKAQVYVAKAAFFDRNFRINTQNKSVHSKYSHLMK